MGAKMKVATRLLNGIRVGQFTDTKTLEASEVIQEAIDGGYVTGKRELIEARVSGILKSMAKGVSRDGNGRKVDELVSIQPSLSCKLADPCDPVRKEDCTAKLIARVLPNAQIDASDWSFVIEGATAGLTIDSISDGTTMGVVKPGAVAYINGDGFLSTAVVKAACEGTEITVAAAKVTINATRITLAADALSAFAGSTYVGKTMVFTITQGTQKGIKAAEVVA